MDTNKSLPSIGTLFSWSWEKYREGFWKYVGFMVLATGLLTVLVIIVLSLIGLSLFALSSIGLFIAIPIALIGFVIGTMLAESIQLFIPYSIFTGASFKDAFKWSLKNSWSAFAIGLILGVIILGGYVLFFVPAIILAMIFFLAKYVFIEEGKTGFAALARAREYTAGFFWEVLMRTLAIGFGFGAIATIWFILITIGTLIHPVLGGILNLSYLAFTLVVIPFLQIFIYGIFKQLKETKSELKDASIAPGSKSLGIGFFIWGLVAIVGLIFLFSFVLGTIADQYNSKPRIIPMDSYSRNLNGKDFDASKINLDYNYNFDSGTDSNYKF